MANSNRDEGGRFAAANGGGSQVAPLASSARPSIGEMHSMPNPDDIINPSTKDALLSGTVNPRPARQAPSLPTNQPVTIPDYTRGINEVLGNSGGGGGGGGGDFDSFDLAEPDYSQAKRAMGRDDNPGEGPGDHQVITAEGPAYHGADVPGTGVPSPADVAESVL